MSTTLRQLQYGDHWIEFTVLHRDRKTLEIAVEPDTSVIVVAPLNASPEAIDAKVRQRATWVRRQQSYFQQFLPRTPERRFLSGETHRYLGRQYRLDVVQHIQSDVKLVRGYIVVQSHYPDHFKVTQKLVEGWYRERAQLKFQERIAVNLARFPEPDSFRPQGLTIRRMTHRWGSMSLGGRLTLNPRLIEAPRDAIDYVITHELSHIQEPNHSKEFFRILGRAMPDWERRKLLLEEKMA